MRRQRVARTTMPAPDAAAIGSAKHALTPSSKVRSSVALGAAQKDMTPAKKRPKLSQAKLKMLLSS